MSREATARMGQVHRNPKYFPKQIRLKRNRFWLETLDGAYPDRKSCNEEAYGNEGQNIVYEIGHVGNSSLFTSVCYLFYFCS